MFENSMKRIQIKDHKIRTMKYIRFLCLALVIKYTSKAMDGMDWLLSTTVNYKNIVILITIKKMLFCQANCFNFSLVRAASLSSISNLKNTKN